MTSSVDRLDSECLGRSSEIRQSNRSIGCSGMRQVVGWFEPASCDPVDAWSPYINRRHMYESCELRHRQYAPIFGVFFESFSVDRLIWPPRDQLGSVGLRKYMETRCKFPSCGTRLPERSQDDLRRVAIAIELALIRFSFFFFITHTMFILNVRSSCEERGQMRQ